jgi:hypothetical protein
MMGCPSPPDPTPGSPGGRKPNLKKPICSALGLLLSGCGGAEPPSASEVSSPEAVRYELVAEFGGGEPGPWFSRIFDGFYLDERTLAVADGEERVIWVLDVRTGTGERLGREGEGPGEFRGITRMGVGGDDALWVTDRITGRVTYFSSGDPSVVSTVTLREYVFAPPVAPEGPVGVLGDGRYLFMPGRVERRSPSGPDRIPYPLLAMGADASTIDTLVVAAPAPPPVVLVPRPDGGFNGIVNFLEELPLLALEPGGKRVGLLDRFGGTGPETMGVLHVAHLSEEGWKASRHPVPGPSIPGSRHEVEGRIRQLQIDWPGPQGEMVDAVLAQVEIPTWLSPITRYRIDGEGRHWIGVEPEFRGPRSWRRGDPEARSWDRVEFDRPVEWPLDATGDYVSAVLTDALEVQTVGLFRRSAVPARP